MKWTQQHRGMWLLAGSMLLCIQACGSKPDTFDQSTVPLIEIQPENQGAIEPFIYTITYNRWNENFTSGDQLVQDLHFSFDETLLPEGLALEITIIGPDTARFELVGQANHHHINHSVDIPFTFYKQAFLGASENAFTRQPKTISLRVVFGKGFGLSGTLAAAESDEIILKELSSLEQIRIAPGETSWAMTKKIEPIEPYTLQIEKHPAGKCCYLSHGDGIMGTQDIKNIQLSCRAPDWEDADTLTQDLASNHISIPVPSMDAQHSKLISNGYGDAAVVWQSNIDGSSAPQGFVSFYHANTDQWVHPQQKTASGMMSVGLVGSNAGISTQGKLHNSKDFNLLLFKQTVTESAQNLFDWFGKNTFIFQGLAVPSQGPSNLIEDGAFTRTLYRQGNQHLTQVKIEENGLNYRFIYNYHKDYNQPLARYLSQQDIDLAEIPQSNYGGDTEPYIDGVMNQQGDGFVIWKTKPSAVSDDQDLFLLDIEGFVIAHPSTQQLQLNQHPVVSKPLFKMNENGDRVIIWSEYTVSNGYTIHRAERAAGELIWKNSSGSNDPTYPPIYEYAQNSVNTHIYDLVQNAQGNWAVAAMRNNDAHFLLLFDKREQGFSLYTPWFTPLLQPINAKYPAMGDDGLALDINDAGEVVLAVSAGSGMPTSNAFISFAYVLPEGDLSLTDPQVLILSEETLASSVETQKIKAKTALFEDGSMDVVLQQPSSANRFKVERRHRSAQKKWVGPSVSVDHLDPLQVIGDVELVDVAHNKRCGQSVILWQAETTSGMIQQKTVRK